MAKQLDIFELPEVVPDYDHLRQTNATVLCDNCKYVQRVSFLEGLPAAFKCQLCQKVQVMPVVESK